MFTSQAHNTKPHKVTNLQLQNTIPFTNNVTTTPLIHVLTVPYLERYSTDMVRIQISFQYLVCCFSVTQRKFLDNTVYLYYAMNAEAACSRFDPVEQVFYLFLFIWIELQPVLHQSVYHGIFTVRTASLSSLTGLFVAMP